jgi:2-succinyl-6-hydroxy-2,4-cyclohexadiene-1-carboxylate synthase
VRVVSVELAVTELGTGPPLVILHGFTGCAESMEEVARALTPCFRTLRLDLIGHGASPAPAELAPYRMEACADQLHAALWRAGAQSAHWLGYSMGGRAALAFALRHPAAVRSMLLVGASAGIADPDERAARRAADDALAERIEHEGLEGFVDEWMALPLFASQKRLGEAALAAARAQRLRNRPHGLANSLRCMGTGAQPALHERLGALSRPVLLAVGDEDAKFLAIAEHLAARLPDARVEAIPEAGHAAHLEQPRAFAASAARFFNHVERARAGTAEALQGEKE